MTRSIPTLNSILDLPALQKRADIEAIYNHVSPLVTEARQALLYAIERHDVDYIQTIIQQMREKIEQQAQKAPSVGHYLNRKPIDSEEMKVYRDIIKIGHHALQGLAIEQTHDKRVVPLRSWDA